MRYKNKPIERALPADDGAFEFERNYAGKLYAQLDAIYEWKAGRPSDYDLCEPSADLALMRAFLKAKRNIRAVQDKEQARKMEDETARRRLRAPRGRYRKRR